MIYNISYGPIANDEALVIEYLRQNQFKKIIDIGGVQRPWARPYVTHYADLIQPKTWADRYPCMLEYQGFWDKQFIIGDLEEDHTWEIIVANGPYDFVICTQTIEHLLDPRRFAKKLSAISSSGFVSVPHMICELRKGVHWGQSFRGMLPHRWISKITNGELILYPKLNFIEYMDFDWAEKGVVPDLSFWWQDNLDLNVINDSFLDFSDPQEAIDFYKRELGERELGGTGWQR